MDALGIDAKLLLAQIINFAIFFVIFKKFIAGPFLEYLKKEKNKETERQEILQELEKKEKELQERQEAVLQTAAEQAGATIADAKKTAVAVREEIIEKAALEAKDIHAKAKKQLELEREKLYAELKKQLIVAGAQIAKKALADFIDQKQQQKIFKRLVGQINKADIYEN